MTYRIEYVCSAAKAYSRLQSDDDLYRVRISDLRLLFSMEDQVLFVLVVKIG